MEQHLGRTFAWCGTKTNGTIWAIWEDEKSGWFALQVIDQGDHLTIFDSDGKILFHGIIDQDREAGWQAFPPAMGGGQPVAHGRWIHWTQRGWSPDEWAEFFLPEYRGSHNTKPYRAKLVKKAAIVTSLTLAFEPTHDTYRRPFEEG